MQNVFKKQQKSGSRLLHYLGLKLKSSEIVGCCISLKLHHLLTSSRCCPLCGLRLAVGDSAVFIGEKREGQDLTINSELDRTVCDLSPPDLSGFGLEPHGLLLIKASPVRYHRPKPLEELMRGETFTCQDKTQFDK